MTSLEPVQTLDLRDTKCPLNFVKTRLALEKLNEGDILEVWIKAESQSSLNIPKSIQQEGHMVLEVVEEGGLQKIRICKAV